MYRQKQCRVGNKAPGFPRWRLGASFKSSRNNRRLSAGWLGCDPCNSRDLELCRSEKTSVASSAKKRAPNPEPRRRPKRSVGHGNRYRPLYQTKDARRPKVTLMAGPHNLNRFVEAQADNYEHALAEIKNGHKQSHWIWFIFPQFDGLGFSPTSQHYAIKSIAEA